MKPKPRTKDTEPVEVRQARARVHDPARWLFAFGHRDLTTLSRDDDDDVTRLGWEVLALLQATRTPIGTFGRWTAPPSLPAIRDCQQWLQAGLKKIERGESWEPHIVLRPVFSRSDGGLTRGLGVQITPDGEMVGGESGETPSKHFLLVEAFKTTVVAILWDAHGRVRRCGNAPCGALLLQTHGLQRYCSARCSQTARSRTYRQQHPIRFRRARRMAYAVKQAAVKQASRRRRRRRRARST